MQEKIGYEGRRLQKGLFVILVQTCSYVHAELIKTKTEIELIYKLILVNMYQWVKSQE